MSLVAHWKMNDNAASTVVLDSSGNGYHGTSQQNTSDLTTTGKVNGALTFNGTTDYVDTGQTFQSVFRDSFSISLWIKYDTASNLTYFCAISDGGNNGIVFGTGASGILDMQYTANGKAVITENTVFSNGVGNWYFTVLVVQKTSESTVVAKLYLNSVLVASDSSDDCAMSDYTSIYNLYIGANNNAGTGILLPFDGSLDNFMLFNHALSQAEITRLYNNGNGTENISEMEVTTKPTRDRRRYG